MAQPSTERFSSSGLVHASKTMRPGRGRFSRRPARARTSDPQKAADRGAQGRNRTADTGIFNPLLYQLSYLGRRRVNSPILLSLSTVVATETPARPRARAFRIHHPDDGRSRSRPARRATSRWPRSGACLETPPRRRVSPARGSLPRARGRLPRRPCRLCRGRCRLPRAPGSLPRRPCSRPRGRCRLPPRRCRLPPVDDGSLRGRWRRPRAGCNLPRARRRLLPARCGLLRAASSLPPTRCDRPRARCGARRARCNLSRARGRLSTLGDEPSRRGERPQGRGEGHVAGRKESPRPQRAARRQHGSTSHGDVSVAARVQ